MGRIRRGQKVKLFAGLLSGNAENFERAEKALERRFGRIDFKSEVLDFTHTDYYEEEMGPDLKRLFIGFEKLVEPAKAYKAKLVTNKIESAFLRGRSKRSVNIDPGYLDLSKVVFFSTKDYSHRIYLNNGIFAEVTLFYKDKNYNAWPWTYPDYKTKDYADIFSAMRGIYKNKILG